MELGGKVTVVTGGGHGIGRAIATRFAAEGAALVVVADVDGSATETVAEEINAATEDGRPVAVAVTADVSLEADVRRVVEVAELASGPVDLFCSNAGIGGGGGVDASDEDWQRIWSVNFMAHVFAARAVLPSMLARKEGYLLQTASAAGLLTNIGNAPYSVTKHAVVALAEWIAIAHGDQGIKVSCLCPQGVRTNMLLDALGIGDEVSANVVAAAGGLLEPDAVADVVVEGLRDERFLILPHPEVAQYWKRKVDDPDRWLAGMRRLQARVQSGGVVR